VFCKKLLYKDISRINLITASALPANMALFMPAFLKQLHHHTYPAIDPTREELSAKGKFVVVTGGGGGIGPHIAEAFAKAGAANIALLGRTERSLLLAKQFLEDKYIAKVFTYVADVGHEATVNEAFRGIESMGLSMS
jgi:FlaA1/EpsC-like NDP-sugar epimerase